MTRFALSIICAALLIGCGNSGSGNNPTAENTPGSTGKATPEGPVAELKTVDSAPGEGPAAEKGDMIVLLYRGFFKDGSVFDGNMDANFKPDDAKSPYAIEVGAGMVIKGWDEGLVGVKKGTKRRLSIPWTMAYGAEGRDKIPPKTDLFFDVQILYVKKKGDPIAIETKEVKDGSGRGITEADTAIMSYTGVLLNGKVFDKRDKEKMPMKRFHTGLLEAVLGMKKGGKRKVLVPPGAIPAAFSIPQGQVVEFEFELHDIK
jgi:FKBP-type peptidyl-prolyl cis-trans isomerase